VLASLAGLVTLVACATGDPGPLRSVPPPAPSQAEVVGVHPGPDERSVVLDLRLLGPDPACGRDPRLGVVSDEAGLVFANIVVDVEPDVACDEYRSVSVTVSFDMVVSGRVLVLNNSQTWELIDGADYQLCAERLGCHPPADRCDRAWIDELLFQADTPQHTYTNTVHCDQTWLVLEINTNAGACGAGRPGCSAPPNTRRVFYEWRDRWVAIAGGQDAGCPAELDDYPAFPTEVCAGLPAP